MPDLDPWLEAVDRLKRQEAEETKRSRWLAAKRQAETVWANRRRYEALMRPGP